MSSRHLKFLGGLVLLGFIGACFTAPSVEANRCQIGTVLKVSSGITPLIHWTPQCFVGGLLVQTASGLDYGTVTSRKGKLPANLMVSGITYGTLPPDGRATSAAHPLTAGTQYLAHIYSHPPGKAPTEVGQVYFTP